MLSTPTLSGMPVPPYSPPGGMPFSPTMPTMSITRSKTRCEREKAVENGTMYLYVYQQCISKEQRSRISIRGECHTKPWKLESRFTAMQIGGKVCSVAGQHIGNLVRQIVSFLSGSGLSVDPDHILCTGSTNKSAPVFEFCNEIIDPLL